MATVFTTHATLLGRMLCAGAADFYNNLKNFNCDEEAGRRGFYHRYCIERAAAHLSQVFTAVRYEFGNKGADVFIESLARLNYQLKESKSDKTVIAFLIFPTKTNSFNVESLRGCAVAKGLKDTIDEIQKEIGVRLYET